MLRAEVGTGSRLEVVDLWTSFGGNHVHRDLNLKFEGGQVTGLIGPNGCGKSTLFNVITGVVKPRRGRVLLQGKDISSMPPWKRYRAGITRSFQNLEIFERLSVRDNIRVGLGRGADRERVDECLEMARLAPVADRLPSELSYGQRKALSLARIRGRTAIAVLLDEPAAGLSAKEVAPILEIASALAESGAVVCLVEHNMQVMAGYANVVHLMAAGQVLASGHFDDLVADPSLAKVFFGSRR